VGGQVERRVALHWATSKRDSGNRHERFHPDPEGIANGCSVYVHSGSPSKITQGYTSFFSVAWIRIIASLHMHNLSAVFNKGSPLSLQDFNRLK